jgi:hypothetical protein
MRTVNSYFVNSNKKLLDEAVVAFLADVDIGFTAVDRPSFRNMMSCARAGYSPPHRRAIRRLMKEVAAVTREEVINVCKLCAGVTISIDGWTNVRQCKVTNVLLIADGVAFYWNSHENVYFKVLLCIYLILYSFTHIMLCYVVKNEAAYVVNFMTPIIDDLLTRGVKVNAIVTDNEQLMVSVRRQIKQRYPWFVRVADAAHIIQLIVKSALATPTLARSFAVVKRVVKQYQCSIQARRNLLARQQATGATPKRLKYSCPTRWNSELQMAKRFFDLKEPLKMTVPVAVQHLLTNQFFRELEIAIEFLQPFQYATDVVQRDGTNLNGALQQFQNLHASLQAYACPSDDDEVDDPLRSALRHTATDALVTLERYWLTIVLSTHAHRTTTMTTPSRHAHLYNQHLSAWCSWIWLLHLSKKRR